MMGRLARFLSPKRIAVVGGRECGVAIEQCRRAGFAGAFEAVHPQRDDLAGVPCVRSVEDLSEPPDAVFLAVPPEASIEQVRRLAAIGAGGVVCYAAGFKEAGEAGAALQAELVEAAGAMPILGPNCYGLLNYLDGVALWPDVHGGARVERGVAIVAQSGNLGINFTLQDRSLPISHVVSIGNAAQIQAPELIEAFADDPRVSAIGLHLESVQGGAARFAEAVRAAQRAGKPIVVLKTGRSAAGARATLSHTSSMAGGAAAFDALLDRLGAPQAHGVPGFLETLKLLHVVGPLPAARVVCISCSGGEAALSADAAERLGVETPALGAASQSKLSTVLGAHVAIDNPLDYHTYIWLDQAAQTACFTAALEAPSVEAGIVILDYPRAEAGDNRGWDMAVDAAISAARATGTPTLVAPTLSESLPGGVREKLMAAGVAPIQGVDEALAAIAAAATVARGFAEAAAGDVFQPLAAPAETGGGVALDEWRAKKRLAAAGLTVPDGVLAADATEAVAAAEALGYPVVLKAVSATLLHKSEAGGVALNLTDADAVAAAAARMAGVGERFLVERMIDGAAAEMILGLVPDAQAGWMLMIGSGGVTAELLGDRALIPLPARVEDVERALDRLALAPLLAGYRGRPAADRAAVVQAALALARFGEAEGGRLIDCEINPLIVREAGRGAVAADALILFREGDA
ncbi:MAG: acetate--CoA ligase family protein [Marivibrio sp.]|uniref:acetate--CoA ligase family protein n=1 Tax=Marivibrio sp. TaxID=2039719 RepID=UPI0032EB90B0